MSQKMIQSLTCSYEGHERNKIKYVCLDSECQQNKLLCSQCYIDKNHKHVNDGKIFDHIQLQVSIQSKIDYLQQQVSKADDLFVQRCIEYVKEIQQQMNKILDNLKKLQVRTYTEKNIFDLQNLLKIIKNTKLNQVDDKFISELTKIDYSSNKQIILQEIKQQCDLLMSNSISMQQLSVKVIQESKLKDFEYQTSQLDQDNDLDIYSATISNDLNYIVTSRADQVLKIWNNLDYQLIQEYNLNDKVLICKFSEDSNLLYIATGSGILCCYDARNNFKQIYKQKIHHNSILNLYCITNHLILTSSFDKYLIKTNTRLNQQLLIIQAHNDRIDGLDYHQQKELIATCSKDNFIKLWDSQNGSLLIQQQNEYQSIMNQVLFINQTDQLICLDSKTYINIWKIKYESKELILFYTIKANNMVFNISLVLNQSFILLLCQDQMIFYNIQGEQVHQIDHKIKEYYMIRQVQLDSLQQIIIQGKKQIQIFRMKK